ncbi:hypothetical protein [Desulfovibrio psychrotolerans]|uniref:Uncharacterized protein n=1 Tax=Desulfovibrio psychrotolerans TaxID=415242 RepID=A0A7J0BTS9_9BACT|nr:hypothetical protein [Desulfovibrio psychrotolerans]GFM36394.1 hypothetical protein DSM19430T_10780 [Desulfovibrio psychrotolerans]
MNALNANREELVRLARESGLPVSENASVTEVVLLLSDLPILADELSEALNHILGNVREADYTAHA